MTTVPEEWRPVVGLEGQYEVSNLGRVKSLPKMVSRRNGRYMKKERLIGGRSRAAGYPVVHIGPTCRYIHSLVLEAFVGPRPDGFEACHNNGDRTDNRAENLRWDTPSANQNDRAKHGTSNRGERCGTSILKSYQVIAIMRSTERTSVLARQYGVAPQTISGIRCGWKWQHLRETAKAG
jgi:hypothetical protein